MVYTLGGYGIYPTQVWYIPPGGMGWPGLGGETPLKSLIEILKHSKSLIEILKHSKSLREIMKHS